MNEYIDLVKTNHPFFKKESLSVDIEKKFAEGLPGAQDWSLSLTPYYSYLGEATAAESQADRIHSAGVEASIERKIWKTGSNLGFTFTSTYANSDSALGTMDYYRHGIGVSYTHPLLQNAKGTLDRLSYELSDYTIEFTKARSIENQEDFLLEIAFGFLDWIYLSEVIRISEERLKLAQEQKDQTEKKFRSNLVDKVDVLRAEDAVRIAEQALLKTESLWKAKQAELAVLAGSEELYKKEPAFDLYSVEKLPGIEESSERLQTQSRILNTFDILKDQLSYTRVGLVEQKRPGLNLTVAGGLYGRDDKFGKSLEIYKPDASISLVYFTTLEHRTVKAEIERVDLQIEQLENDKRNIETSLEALMRNLLIQITESVKILELNQAQIISAAEKTEEELKLYNQGRGQLTFVIQSRDNEENAKLTYAENAASYQALILQYRSLMDELLTEQ
jgi:outer membrane protein TolC